MSSLLTKHLITGALAPLLFVTCLVASVHATSFNWSYVFDNGWSIEGMLEAERGGPSGTGREELFFIDSGMATARNPENEIIFDTVDIRGEFSENLSHVVLTASDNSTPKGGGFFYRGGLFARAFLDNMEVRVASDDPPNQSFLIIEKTDPIPAPSTLLLFSTGMLGLLAWAHRKKTSGTS